MAGGDHPSCVLLRAPPRHRPDVHAAHRPPQTPVRRSLQPQSTGGGRGTPRDGQHAQATPRGTTHMTPYSLFFLP